MLASQLCHHISPKGHPSRGVVVPMVVQVDHPREEDMMVNEEEVGADHHRPEDISRHHLSTTLQLHQMAMDLRILDINHMNSQLQIHMPSLLIALLALIRAITTQHRLLLRLTQDIIPADMDQAMAIQLVAKAVMKMTTMAPQEALVMLATV